MIMSIHDLLFLSTIGPIMLTKGNVNTHVYSAAFAPSIVKFDATVRQNMQKEHPRLDACVELSAFTDFKQNSEGRFSAVDATIIIKFTATIRRNETKRLIDAFKVLSVNVYRKNAMTIQNHDLGFVGLPVVQFSLISSSSPSLWSK